MKNKLSDLNNHLFAQLERLGDEDIIDEKLDEEIGRSKAITDVSKVIVGNARLVLDAQKFKSEHGLSITVLFLKVTTLDLLMVINPILLLKD